MGDRQHIYDWPGHVARAPSDHPFAVVSAWRPLAVFTKPSEATRHGLATKAALHGTSGPTVGLQVQDSQWKEHDAAAQAQHTC